MNQAPDTSKTLHSRIVSGSLVLLSGSGLTAAVNLLYNVAVARFLGPVGFGQATAVYTLLTLISAVTLSFQLVAAKAVAQGAASGHDMDARAIGRSAWLAGALIAGGLLVCSVPIAAYLHLPGLKLIILLAVGSVFYVPLGSRRGIVQGAYGFRKLAANLLLEGLVRLGGSVLLAGLGYGVAGVMAANAAAVAVAYLVIAPQRPAAGAVRLSTARMHRELAQALVFFSGQVLINNCDIVLVKHFFSPTAAGLYAVIAMVGRVIFALCQAVVNSMVPVVAATGEQERKGLRLLGTSLLLVLGIGALFTAALRLAPAALWPTLFGPGFLLSGPYGFPSLLALYAAMTVLYALSTVVITYEMSYKIANMSWVQLLFSFLIVGGICRYHGSLSQVILVQVVLISVMLLFVGTPFLPGILRRPEKKGEKSPASTPVRLLRGVREHEVIAEFLQSEFGKPGWSRHSTLARLVYTPDFDNTEDNAKRRALFHTRHLALWTELPKNTVWHEAELTEADLARIRVFPRAHWRRIGRREGALAQAALHFQSVGTGPSDAVRAKIEAIRARYAEASANLGAVLLIGTSESSPLVILDGNHRLVAAVLEGQTHKLRVFCGFSPDMARCCWYRTSPATLFRYGVHLLGQVGRNPEAALAALLRQPRPAVAPRAELTSQI